MKKAFLPLTFCLVFSSTVLFGQSFSKDKLELLNGYWESTWTETIGKYEYNRVLKLFFTKDSLVVSNFGSQVEAGLFVSCAQGTWMLRYDTLGFSPDILISFSTNTGFYYRDSTIRDSIWGNGFVIKEITSDKLTVDLHGLQFIPCNYYCIVGPPRHTRRVFNRAKKSKLCTYD